MHKCTQMFVAPNRKSYTFINKRERFRFVVVVGFIRFFFFLLMYPHFFPSLFTLQEVLVLHYKQDTFIKMYIIQVSLQSSQPHCVLQQFLAKNKQRKGDAVHL